MMWWWIISLYLIGWGFTFRKVYLREYEQTQRSVEELRRNRRNYTEQAILDRQSMWLWADRRKSTAFAFIWPLVLAFLFVKFLIFPRGIKTKYDREKELERQKAEADKQYQEAKALLKDNGIEV